MEPVAKFVDCGGTIWQYLAGIEINGGRLDERAVSGLRQKVDRIFLKKQG